MFPGRVEPEVFAFPSYAFFFFFGMVYHCKSWNLPFAGNSSAYSDFVDLKCQQKQMQNRSSQLPELQNIQFNGLTGLLTPCKAPWSPSVRLRVIVLSVVQAPTKRKMLTGI